jgi:hypothetical protein
MALNLVTSPVVTEFARQDLLLAAQCLCANNRLCPEGERSKTGKSGANQRDRRRNQYGS